MESQARQARSAAELCADFEEEDLHAAGLAQAARDDHRQFLEPAAHRLVRPDAIQVRQGVDQVRMDVQVLQPDRRADRVEAAAEGIFGHPLDDPALLGKEAHVAAMDGVVGVGLQPGEGLPGQLQRSRDVQPGVKRRAGADQVGEAVHVLGPRLQRLAGAADTMEAAPMPGVPHHLR